MQISKILSSKKSKTYKQIKQYETLMLQWIFQEIQPQFLLNKSVCSLNMQSLLHNSHHLSNLLTLSLLRIGPESKNIFIDQQVFCQMVAKYLKTRSVDNFQIILITFYQTSNVVFEKPLAPSIAFY